MGRDIFEAVLAKDGPKLTRTELIRAIRFCLSEEIHAAEVYQKLAESISDRASQNILLEIADHELMHIGQFYQLMCDLSKHDEALYIQGAQETEDML